jgi:hypothetical protein
MIMATASQLLLLLLLASTARPSIQVQASGADDSSLFVDPSSQHPPHPSHHDGNAVGDAMHEVDFNQDDTNMSEIWYYKQTEGCCWSIDTKSTTNSEHSNNFAWCTDDEKYPELKQCNTDIDRCLNDAACGFDPRTYYQPNQRYSLGPQPPIVEQPTQPQPQSQPHQRQTQTQGQAPAQQGNPDNATDNTPPKTLAIFNYITSPDGLLLHTNPNIVTGEVLYYKEAIGCCWYLDQDGLGKCVDDVTHPALEKCNSKRGRCVNDDAVCGLHTHNAKRHHYEAGEPYPLGVKPQSQPTPQASTTGTNIPPPDQQQAGNTATDTGAGHPNGGGDAGLGNSCCWVTNNVDNIMGCLNAKQEPWCTFDAATCTDRCGGQFIEDLRAFKVRSLGSGDVSIAIVTLPTSQSNYRYDESNTIVIEAKIGQKYITSTGQVYTYEGWGGTGNYLSERFMSSCLDTPDYIGFIGNDSNRHYCGDSWILERPAQIEYRCSEYGMHCPYSCGWCYSVRNRLRARSPSRFLMVSIP